MSMSKQNERELVDSSVIESSGNVFVDLGFDAAEASVLAMRAKLMIKLREEIDRRRLTQAMAAKILNVTQPRVSALKKGNYKAFSLDTLVEFSVRLGKPVRLSISSKAVPARKATPTRKKKPAASHHAASAT